MRTVWALALSLFLLPALSAADAPASAPANNAAEADAEWESISKAMRPPAQPAEWQGKAPSQQAELEFNQKLGDMSETVANRAKEFYEKYPNHSRVDDARAAEKRFRAQAEQFRKVNIPGADAAEKPADDKPKEPEKPRDPAFEALFAQVVERLREARPQGFEAFTLEALRGGHALASQFPNEPEGWQMIAPNLRYLRPEAALMFYKMMYTNGPANVREYARPEIKRAEMVGKPLSLSYTAVDGREVSLEKLKGKVVLLNFWATWCPPCVASMPELQALNEKYRDQGFEIVGISLDEDVDELKRFLRRTKLPWPQYVYGPDKKNAIQQQFEIRVTPSHYLVDKKGILRDINAGDDLPGKIAALLKE